MASEQLEILRIELPAWHKTLCFGLMGVGVVGVIVGADRLYGVPDRLPGWVLVYLQPGAPRGVLSRGRLRDLGGLERDAPADP